MLSANEFTVGTVADAPTGSLVIPRSKDEASMLVGSLDGAPVAVFLGERFQFQHFPTSEGSNWSGLIIPGVSIEVDEATAFDAAYGRMLGAAVRQADYLGIYATTDRSGGGRARVVPFATGLSKASDASVGFRSWQIVVGSGYEKRVLHSVQVQPRKPE